MDRFDEILKERAKQEPFPVPEDYADRVARTCAALKEAPAGRRRPSPWTLWAAAVLAMFIAVPNVSPAAAAALAEVPVLGAIVELVTFRNYTWDDGVHSMDVSVPELTGGAGAREVDEQVREYTERVMAEFR